VSIADIIVNYAKRAPYFHLKGYMNRYWLVPFEAKGGTYTDGCVRMTWRRPLAKVLQLCGIAVRVHEILRSDEGRDPHDHPWPFLTIILRGGYWETRYDRETGEEVGTKWHGPGSVLFRPAGAFHMLTLRSQLSFTSCGEVCHRYDQTVTLFITGRYQQRWGFLTAPDRKVPYDEYSKGAR
jgi:hypothetical protein